MLFWHMPSAGNRSIMSQIMHGKHIKKIGNGLGHKTSETTVQSASWFFYAQNEDVSIETD